MKNVFKLLGIIALAAVIGFSMAGCKNDDDGDDPNPQTGGLSAPSLTASRSGTVPVGTTVNFTWNSVSGATGYIMYGNVITPYGETGWDVMKQYSSTTTFDSVYFDSDFAGWTVQLSITALKNGKESPRSNTVSVTISGGSTQPQPNTSLDGVWEMTSRGLRITINGRTGVFSAFGTLTALWTNAKDNGYIKIGDQYCRNLTSTGNLTWSGEVKTVTNTSSKPTVATGTSWRNATFTMSANGQTLTVLSSDTSGNITSTFTRQ
jgi:hypothetical protein